MPDRENAIKCLIDIEQIMIARQEICPREELQYWIELQEGVADALALLKQEAVTPIRMNHSEKAGFDNYLCGECKNEVYYKQKYCDECGRSVKWE